MLSDPPKIHVLHSCSRGSTNWEVIGPLGRSLGHFKVMLLKKKNKIPVPSPTHSHTLDEQFAFPQCFPRCVSSLQPYHQQGQPAMGQILYKWEAKYSFFSLYDYLRGLGALLHLFICLFIRGHVWACMSQSTCGGQRITYRNWFSPSPMWVSGISSKPSGLAERKCLHPRAPTQGIC